MKNYLHCNQKTAIDLGIKNINQALILDLLSVSSTWCQHHELDGEIYYWFSRQKICAELPILNLKPDTVYRHLKKLKELGVIDYEKDGKKDLIRLTKKGKNHYVGNESENSDSTMSEMNPNYYAGNESEINKNSEMNPKKLGNESEKHSEMNPTYTLTNKHIHKLNNTNIHKGEKNKKSVLRKQKQITKKFIPPEFINNQLWEEWLLVRKKKKAVNSETALKALINNLNKCVENGIDANEAITLAIEQSWKSIKPEWFANFNNPLQTFSKTGHSYAKPKVSESAWASLDF